MILYGFILRSYFLAIWVASFWSAKSKHWIAGRKDWKIKLSQINFSEDQWLWFHASSFGEFNDGKTLIESIKRDFPSYKILLTFFSPSGYEANKTYPFADVVHYLPLDTGSNARYFLDIVKPEAIFFMRNDIWPNYLREIQKRTTPAFLYSYTIKDDSAFLQFPQRVFYRKAFNRFTRIFAHDTGTEKVLAQNKFSSAISVSGNLRIDAVLNGQKEKFQDKKIETFLNGAFCVLAGSTHQRDRKLFLNAFANHSDLTRKWIIVPHEIDQSEIHEAQKMLGNKMALYSETKNMDAATLLWVDRVGVLSKLYRYANMAYIGGGFDRMGIHSILEPAAYGCPMCFGPNHRNYSEAIEMLSTGGARIVKNNIDLLSFITHLQQNVSESDEIKKLNLQYVGRHAGATEKVLNYLKENNYLT